MRKRLTIIFAALSLTACIVIVHATPAQDRLWATRVKCELQTAGAASLPDIVWQQGSTPLLSLDQFRVGKSVDADSNVVAIVRFGPSATNAYFVTATNYAVSANGYLVQLPTIGTNTTAVGTGADWWYTAYFERAGYRYWTGNGRVKIVATTSTADGLNWQVITSGSDTNFQAAINAEAAARAAGDAVSLTNWQAVVYSLTNGAALGETALQPADLSAFAATGTVWSAERLGGTGSWSTVENGTNWLYTVTRSSNVVVSAMAGDGYNGPAVGTVFLAIDFTEDSRAWLWNTDILQELFGTYELTDPLGRWFGTGDFPVILTATSGDADGICVFDWLPQTNRVRIATEPMVSEAIDDHNANGAAHADIRAQIAAIPTNVVGGGLVWDSGSNVFWRVSATNLRFYVWP